MGCGGGRALIRKRGDLATGLLLTSWLLAELRSCHGLMYSVLCISFSKAGMWLPFTIKRITVALVAPIVEITILTLAFLFINRCWTRVRLTIDLNNAIGALCGLTAVLLNFGNLMICLFWQVPME
jgi:hypothetical protein